MKKVVVYRVVGNDGKGMYHGRGFCDVEFQHDQRHPGPWADEALVKDREAKEMPAFGDNDQLYGFRSKEQLRKWVHGKHNRRAMCSKGFTVRKFKVPANRVALGRTQVVFMLPDATLVDSIKLSAI